MNIRLILKRSAQLLIVPMLALMVVGCNEKDPDTITVTGTVADSTGEVISVLPVSSEGGKYFVYPSTETWTVTSSKDWCVPQRGDCQTYDSDKSLELYIYGADKGEDAGSASRYSVVTFTSGAAEYSILVSQSSSSDYITLIPDSKAVGYEASTVAFAVISNSTYQVASSQTWAQVDFVTTPMIVTATIDENPTEEERTAVFTIYSGGTTATFTLTQEGRDPSFVAADIEEYTFSATAVTDATDTKTVKLTHNLTDPTFAVNSTQAWCEAVISTDLEGNQLPELVITTTGDNDLTTSRDESTVTITATAGNIVVTDQITIKQSGVDGPSIVIGSTSYTYGAAANASASLSYVAVGTVSAGTDASWITMGTVNDDELSFGIAANETGEERTGTITISATKGGETAVVVVTIIQTCDPLTLEVSTNSIYVGANTAPETISVTATSNGDLSWTYNSDSSSWCAVAQSPTATASDAETATFTVEANDTGYERTCNITVVATMGSEVLVEVITVTQGCDVYEQTTTVVP